MMGRSGSSTRSGILRTPAGARHVAGHCGGARDAEPGGGDEWRKPLDAGVIDDVPEFHRRIGAYGPDPMRPLDYSCGSKPQKEFSREQVR
jgi:hypothetical protein